MIIAPCGGIELARNWNVIVAESPGAIIPTGIPRVGLASGSETPLSVTLFGTNNAPSGMPLMSNTEFAGKFPVFVNVAVYVITSPIDTIVRFACKTVVTVALLICVEALLEFIVLVTGGEAGSTMNAY